MSEYAGVKFADKHHIDALFAYGFCAFVISAEDREANHPEIGDLVDLLLGESTIDERCRVKLIADQEMPDGGLISIYAPIAITFKKQS
jgi:hypothetical protein